MASTIPKVPLGKNGDQVCRLGFGTMGLSIFYGPTKPDEERLKLLDDVYAAGETFWDSSDLYGDSEDLLGKWFKRTGKRNDIFLATKFGGATRNNSPEFIRESCSKSLQRLGTDVIDLYYCHRIDKDQPIEITVKAMAELKKEGKIRHIGLSECSADTLRRACAVEHIDAVQLEYSPWSLEIEDPQIGLLKTARELGVALVAYSPLGRGFLTGRFRSPDDLPDGDFRKFNPRFSAENFQKNLELADGILKIAKEKNCTSSQLTLAWLMAQGSDIIPIPGTTSLANFKDNLGALDVKLSEEEIATIRALVDKSLVMGARYPSPQMGYLLQDTVPLSV